MWPYTPDEQTWLAPSKDWIAGILADTGHASGRHETQLSLPLPMPAPYDDFVTDPQIMLRK